MPTQYSYAYAYLLIYFNTKLLNRKADIKYLLLGLPHPLRMRKRLQDGYMALDYAAIQEKWQNAWKDAKIFEREPDNRKSLMVFAAWPYVNTPQHLGHFRTYGTADAYARYMSMRGYNTLFPMGWHKTGTPILAIAKRVANKDEDLMNELVETFHLPKGDVEKMTDPFFIADYFSREIRSGMEIAGMGID